MHRIEIVGPSTLLDPVLHTVQEKSVLHIEEIPLAEYGDKGLLHRVSLPDDRLAERARELGINISAAAREGVAAAVRAALQQELRGARAAQGVQVRQIGEALGLLARRRIGEVARESVTVDLLSGGRLRRAAGVGLPRRGSGAGPHAWPARARLARRRAPADHRW